MDALAFIAESRGASGVCAHLQENRKHFTELLDVLAAPVLLDPPVPKSHSEAEGAPIGKDTGIQMEQTMSLKAQREIWSALVRLSGGSHLQSCHEVAVRFLRFAEKKRYRPSDSVCRSLAQAILASTGNSNGEKGDYDDDEKLVKTKRDAEFKEAMKHLTFSRMTTTTDTASSNSSAPPHFKILLSFTRSRSDAREQPLNPHLMKVVEPAHVAPQQRVHSEMPPLKKQRVLQDGEELLQTVAEANAHIEVDAPIAAALSAEVEEKASKLAKQLAQLGTPDGQSNRSLMDEVAKATVAVIQETINATNTTHAANEQIFGRLCEKLHIAASSDEALFQITNALIESNWSSRYAAVFLETSVYPKIVAASSVISRVLLQTALLFSQRYATALVDSLLIPLLTTHAIASAQGEAVTRILRNGIPPEQLDGFLSKSFQYYEKKSTAPDAKHFFTNDAALMVLQNVLTMKATLSDATIERFIECCEAAQEKNDGDLQKSLKFATLVFTMVSKYSDQVPKHRTWFLLAHLRFDSDVIACMQCVAHVEALEGIGKRLTSLMAKSTMRSIQKLKASPASR